MSSDERIRCKWARINVSLARGGKFYISHLTLPVQETGAADHHQTRNGEILIKFQNERQFKSEAKVLACPCVTIIMVGNRKKNK